MPAQRKRPSRQSRVPAGRFERLARFGLLAGEVAIGGLTEAAKRMTGTGTADNSVFVTATNARKLAERLSNMRGAAMKLGQLLSLEGQDFLPAEVADALSILRAEGDSMPEAQLRKVLARNYGKQWERRFLTFGMDPIAAASIGQVHHAIAADGRELALKIQYPGVDQSIESDVDNMASILKLSRMLPGKIDISGILAEAKRQLRQECDYKAEARHLRRYAEMLGDEPGVVIPRVYDDLTTAHILAMDYVEGAPLDVLAEPGHSQRQRDRVGAILYRILLRELFELRYMQTDPNFANYLLLPSGDIALLDSARARATGRADRRYRRIFRASADGDRRAMLEVASSIEMTRRSVGRTRSFYRLRALLAQGRLRLRRVRPAGARARGRHGADLRQGLHAPAAAGDDLPAPQAGRHLHAVRPHRRARERPRAPAAFREPRITRIAEIRVIRG